MRLFVYGTLRSGLAEDPSGCRLGKSRPRVGTGWIHGRMYDLGEFPVGVPDPQRVRRIRGEVFEIGEDREYWNRLDEYEDYKPDDVENSHFLRRRVEVRMDSGERLDAQVYWYRLPVERLPAAAIMIIRSRTGLRSLARRGRKKMTVVASQTTSRNMPTRAST